MAAAKKPAPKGGKSLKANKDPYIKKAGPAPTKFNARDIAMGDPNGTKGKADKEPPYSTVPYSAYQRMVTAGGTPSELAWQKANKAKYEKILSNQTGFAQHLATPKKATPKGKGDPNGMKGKKGKC